MTRVIGLVLAGGRSRRFGTEKAAAQINGRPMIEYAYSVLERGCHVVAINAPEGSFAASWGRDRGLDILPDSLGDPDGPLSGIKAGLVWANQCGAPLLVTAPCDTPRLPGELVSRLAQELGADRAAFAITLSGQHPLCCVWRAGCLGSLEPLLGPAHPPVRKVLDALCAKQVHFSEEAAFLNVNTPDQLGGCIETAAGGA